VKKLRALATLAVLLVACNGGPTGVVIDAPVGEIEKAELISLTEGETAFKYLYLLDK